jgi:hypothetical protein
MKEIMKDVEEMMNHLGHSITKRNGVEKKIF